MACLLTSKEKKITGKKNEKNSLNSCVYLYIINLIPMALSQYQELSSQYWRSLILDKGVEN